MRKETYTCTPEEFLKNARLPVRVMETEADMMEEIAQLMFEAIVAKPNNGKTVIICPVGPIAQYPILAEKINAVLSADLQQMGEASLRKIRPYTLENMAKIHAEIFENGR